MSTYEESKALEWCIKNGHMVRPHNPYDWTQWFRTFCIFPRKSINDKFLWGVMYKRTQAYDDKFYSILGERVYKYQHQYANKKERFKQILTGGQ